MLVTPNPTILPKWKRRLSSCCTASEKAFSVGHGTSVDWGGESDGKVNRIAYRDDTEREGAAGRTAKRGW